MTEYNGGRVNFGAASVVCIVRVDRLSDGDEEEVVFLAALGEDVFAVEKHVGRCLGVGVGDFLFVDREAALLGHLAHFALGGEHFGDVGEQVDEFDIIVPGRTVLTIELPRGVVARRYANYVTEYRVKMIS